LEGEGGGGGGSIYLILYRAREIDAIRV
jgi:hypothetical protein